MSQIWDIRVNLGVRMKEHGLSATPQKTLMNVPAVFNNGQAASKTQRPQPGASSTIHERPDATQYLSFATFVPGYQLARRLRACACGVDQEQQLTFKRCSTARGDSPELASANAKSAGTRRLPGVGRATVAFDKFR